MKSSSIKSILCAVLAASSLAAHAKPLKIYIMAGQSNMTGMARNTTLEHIKMSPDSAREFSDVFDSQGNPTQINQVRVSCWPKSGSEQMGILKPGYGGGTSESMLGPEYGFGIYMHKKLQQPILIIKCGQGGRDLNFNFRPPSAGQWTPPAGHPDVAKPGQTKTSEEGSSDPKKIVSYEYHKMLDHVRNVLKDPAKYHPEYNPNDGVEIAGFIWFQGYNDMINSSVYPNRTAPGGYDQYTWLLEHLVRDLRKDLNAPNMPAVIGVMGIGGIQGTDTNIGCFQIAQAAIADKPEFKGNVAAVHTGKFWDHDLAKLAARASALKKPKRGKGKAETVAPPAPLTPEEQQILKVGVSDAGFHYLGSGKIMVAIGKGFADAMLKLQTQAK